MNAIVEKSTIFGDEGYYKSLVEYQPEVPVTAE